MPLLEGRLGSAGILWALAVVAFDAADGSFTDEAGRLSGGSVSAAMAAAKPERSSHGERTDGANEPVDPRWGGGSRTLGKTSREIASIMTSAVRDLLRSFQSLSDAEKHEAASLLLRQVVQGEAGDVGDESLVAVAEEMFLDLDAREADDGQSSPG